MIISNHNTTVMYEWEVIMDFFSVLTMLGGLALFLYGMHVLGEGLSKASGGRWNRFWSG